MRLSVVIPHVPLSDHHAGLLNTCVKSIDGADEVIVVVNDAIGFAKAVNIGMKAATGDYVCVVNNDIKVVGGHIQRLCVPKTVTSPMLNGTKQDFWGCFFCVPREIIDAIGYLDERFEKSYFEDDDYIIRIKRAGFSLGCVDAVKIESPGNQTMKLLPGFPEAYIRNRDRFIEKWGAPPEGMPEHPSYRH